MISPVTPRRIRWKKFSTSRNPFDISDNTLGAIVCIGAALLASADSVMLDYAESEGVSTNAMMLYASICTLVGATAVDAYYWYVGYGENQHVSVYYISICIIYACTVYFNYTISKVTKSTMSLFFCLNL